MSQFTEYGRVTFRGKLVALGEEDIKGEKINTGFFIEDGKMVPLCTYPDLEYKLVNIFHLYTPAIDFDYLKLLSKQIELEDKQLLGDINIKDYMPECNDATAYNAILDMLQRIQKVFPFISAEYLKLRLPDLQIETDKTDHMKITAAYFMPSKNVFGMCVRNLEDRIGQAYAMHELSHMVGSRAEVDKYGKNFLPRTGFTDEFYNGVGITEGLNEMLSSVARLGDTLSYDQEIRLATLLYTSSGSPTEIIQKFYEGDMYYLSKIGYSEETAKRFVKCVDYHTFAYRYDAERNMNIADTLKIKLYENIKEEFGPSYVITPNIAHSINEAVATYIRDNVKPEFQGANFIGNAQLALLDEMEKGLYDERTNSTQKTIMIDSALKCLVFPRDIHEDALYVSKEDFERTEDRFINILLDLGISEEDIIKLINVTYDEMDSNKKPKELTPFDDADLKSLVDDMYGNDDDALDASEDDLADMYDENEYDGTFEYPLTDDQDDLGDE